MTRINASIKPIELCNSMLFAEYREMKRIPNKIKKGIYNMNNPIPSDFTLNKGHETFFRDKILYLKKRSDELYEELLRRDYDIEDYSSCYEDISPKLFNDWQETKESRDLLKERINQRLALSKEPIRFYNRVVTLDEALIK